MTSTNRAPAPVAVLIAALAAVAAVAGCGHSDGGTGHPKGAVSAASAPSSAASSVASSAGWVPTDPALADVCRSRLPGEARDTLVLIAKGGPYPYRSDGIVFENRESRLPRKASGYYHEFTVVTPGSADRGTRRVVTGNAGEQYWTADHYGTFQEIDARC
ncbi:ribonuclease domain-containing protein [Kitasatospora sp. NPDC047058]|uniref:ribonuclease domain-containing protein n=1 Tax=Kitasatospora sp. NPDC047058 TaxID=3155620 RepID=UPI0033F81AD7